jgi:enoyl-CoA hydratase/carnithine racemase
MTTRKQHATFDEYSEAFADYFVMEREDGILTLRMHTDGGPAKYNGIVHNAWGNAWREIGGDPENEVLVITGTGDEYLAFPQANDLSALPPNPLPDQWEYNTHQDAMKLIENFVFGIDIPTIAAVNGPSLFHTEFALISDLTIAATDATFSDGHFPSGVAPGDGLGLAFQELLGVKRAAYYLYTGAAIDAATALEVGLVNEVLPREQVLPRAQELARLILRSPRAARRFTHSISARPWKRRITEDFGFGLAHETFGISADKIFG